MKSIAIFLMVTMAACSTDSSTRQQTNNEQLSQWALAEGNRLSAQAQTALSSQLKQAMASGGPSAAVEFCNTSAANILDTLSTGYSKLSIGRTSLKIRNPQNTPDETELAMLNDYQTKLQQKSELIPQVRETNEHTLLYTKPILLNNPLCLNCHGSVGSQINNETHQIIQKYYPLDQAVDYQLGDLRGMWTIKFDPEELNKSQMLD